MNNMALAAPRQVYPIVELDFRVRTWANALVFQGFLWAPLPREIACRSGDSRRAEHKNLMADALIYGAMSGLVSFGLWPSTLMLASVLLAMVEDVLNLSKMEAGQTNLVYAPFQPDQLVREVADSMREQIERNGNAFELRCDLPPLALLGDAGKLRQILAHLLSNAGKFTCAAHHNCELMGGTVDVDSQAGAGGRFIARVRAPVAAIRKLAHA